MDIGVHYSRFPVGPEGSVSATLARTAKVAEDGGAALFTLMDHWFQMEVYGGPEEPMLEGYTGLGFVAGQTSRMRLGLLVTGVTYRHPGLLAKTVATLDVLSGGRAQLGIGAAWYDREHAGMGVPFPPLAERFERLEETLQICRQVWGPSNSSYDGKHYQLAETWCVPAPIGDIPVMIGGSGEKKTLRLVAQYADACNLFADDVDALDHKLAVLRGHCEAVDRDFDELTVSVIYNGDPVVDPDAFVSLMHAFEDRGVSLVTISHDGVDPATWTSRLFDEVAPRVR